mmetsp:Transcript_10869/g.28926  ORF Transcript_10869/g.28926 Transcript_10869/m.28926 type:complete len:93 (+) Transcript_10869:206-484(+)
MMNSGTRTHLLAVTLLYDFCPLTVGGTARGGALSTSKLAQPAFSAAADNFRLGATVSSHVCPSATSQSSIVRVLMGGWMLQYCMLFRGDDAK